MGKAVYITLHIETGTKINCWLAAYILLEDNIYLGLVKSILHGVRSIEYFFELWTHKGLT